MWGHRREWRPTTATWKLWRGGAKSSELPSVILWTQALLGFALIPNETFACEKMIDFLMVWGSPGLILDWRLTESFISTCFPCPSGSGHSRPTVFIWGMYSSYVVPGCLIHPWVPPRQWDSETRQRRQRQPEQCPGAGQRRGHRATATGRKHLGALFPRGVWESVHGAVKSAEGDPAGASLRAVGATLRGDVTVLEGRCWCSFRARCGKWPSPSLRPLLLLFIFFPLWRIRTRFEVLFLQILQLSKSSGVQTWHSSRKISLVGGLSWRKPGGRVIAVFSSPFQQKVQAGSGLPSRARFEIKSPCLFSSFLFLWSVPA